MNRMIDRIVEWSRTESRAASGSRRGAILVLAAVLLVVIFAFAAFSIDLGYVALVGTELQNAADAAALAAVLRFPDGFDAATDEALTTAAFNFAAGDSVKLQGSDVEFGRFDLAGREFTPGAANPNAVRVTARAVDRPYFFAPVIGHQQFTINRSAVATLKPRDIVFCIDLSGSMNDDTEPCWATSAINAKLTKEGHGNVGNTLMQQVFNDFNYGAFPGDYRYIGQGLSNVPQSNLAYAVMTQDDGPLTDSKLAAAYRISNTDTEAVRKQKAYRWIMDHQLKPLMPQAKPAILSSNAASYAYWERYLDYIIESRAVGSNPPSSGGGSGGGSSGGGSSGGSSGGGGSTSPPPPKPPAGLIDISRNDRGDSYHEDAFRLDRRNDRPRDLGQLADLSASGIAQLLSTAVVGVTYNGLPRNGSTLRVTLPPSQNGNRITGFNNPNTSTFPGASSSLVNGWRNRVGYVTYLQFMMDFGSDRSPDVANGTNADPSRGTKVPLSVLSPDCPYHSETTAGGTFSFPPSEQPTHALRRALIAAIHEIATKNATVPPSIADRVSIVTFDAISSYHSPKVVMPLTTDYRAAMQSCTKLQAVGDIGNSTATEHGIALARQHLKPPAQGGQGRNYADKIVVLLTDGVPNVWSSSAETVSTYIGENPGGDWYGPDYIWYNAALMQTAQLTQERDRLYPVAVGLGADQDFMDRLARIAGTADEAGLSPRGSGNPADYEAQLVNIFKDIIHRVNGKLVK